MGAQAADLPGGNVGDKRFDDRSESSANDDTYGHVDDIAAHDELLEILNHGSVALGKLKETVASTPPVPLRRFGAGYGDEDTT